MEDEAFERALQDACRRLVNREVNVCLSSLVSTLAQGYGLHFGMGAGAPSFDTLAEEAFELCHPVQDWEEAARGEGWDWDEGGPHFYRNPPGASAFEPYEYQRIESGDWKELCEAEGIEPCEWEIYEHWSVSTWLAEKLKAEGERVGDLADLKVWGRSTTGQAIYIDGVVQRIVLALHGGKAGFIEHVQREG